MQANERTHYQQNQTNIWLSVCKDVSRSEGTIFILQHYTTETEHSKISFASSCCTLISSWNTTRYTANLYNNMSLHHDSELMTLKPKKLLGSLSRYLQFVVWSFQLLLCYLFLRGMGFVPLALLPSWHLSCCWSNICQDDGWVNRKCYQTITR